MHMRQCLGFSIQRLTEKLVKVAKIEKLNKIFVYLFLYTLHLYIGSTLASKLKKARLGSCSVFSMLLSSESNDRSKSTLFAITLL